MTWTGLNWLDFQLISSFYRQKIVRQMLVTRIAIVLSNLCGQIPLFLERKLNNKYMYRSVLVFVSIGLCWSCQLRSEKQETLQRKVDSLENIVEKNKSIAGTLHEVSALIDSIDVSRNLIRGKINEEEGSYKELAIRMKEITAFVRESKAKIAQLDEKLLSQGNSYKEYSAVIKTLEASLESRNTELNQLQKRAVQYDNLNQNLIHLADLQKSEIEDKLVQLQTKQDELVKLQDGVDRLLTSSAEERAENCFIRAQILEETANRTKLAPRKKRNTRLEALELYKMASFYGKDEANPKIAELEKKI
jgi:hypothetical protein